MDIIFRNYHSRSSVVRDNENSRTSVKREQILPKLRIGKFAKALEIQRDQRHLFPVPQVAVVVLVCSSSLVTFRTLPQLQYSPNSRPSFRHALVMSTTVFVLLSAFHGFVARTIWKRIVNEALPTKQYSQLEPTLTKLKIKSCMRVAKRWLPPTHTRNRKS